jgi:hypothetical protein
MHAFAMDTMCDICMLATKHLTTYLCNVTLAYKPLERKKIANLHARLKWHMGTFRRAVTKSGDNSPVVNFGDITARFLNQKREPSEIKVNFCSASFQLAGVIALMKIYANIFELTIDCLRDKILMTPSLGLSQNTRNLILTDKCLELFRAVTLIMKQNVSEATEKLFDIQNNTLFSFLEMEIKLGQVIVIN